MLAPWKKSYDQPRHHFKKQIHYFADKSPSSQSYGFSSSHAWIWELNYKESWVPKNWCFWTMVLEKALESPLDSRRSNQSNLMEITPEYSLERLMLKLKLQYFVHLKWITDSLVKTLMLGKIEGWRRKGWQRMRWLDGITSSMDMSWASSRSCWWAGNLVIGSLRDGHDWGTELSLWKRVGKLKAVLFWVFFFFCLLFISFTFLHIIPSTNIS